MMATWWPKHVVCYQSNIIETKKPSIVVFKKRNTHSPIVHCEQYTTGTSHLKKRVFTARYELKYYKIPVYSTAAVLCLRLLLACRWPLTADTRAVFDISPREICGGQLALGQVFLWYFGFSPVSIIPLTNHFRLHLHVALARRTNRQSWGTLQKGKLFQKFDRNTVLGCIIFLYRAPHEDTGSKNSFLHHDQGHAACEPDLPQHDSKYSSIFVFLLMT
jgi:hypothetical protein